VYRHLRHLSTLSFLCAASAAALAEPSWADNNVPAFALVAHAGRYPSSVGFGDPARSTVGVIYSADPGRAAGGPHGSGYATAFLITTCYAVAGGLAIDAIVPHAHEESAATPDEGALIFSLVAMDAGADGSATTPAWRSTVIARGGQLADQLARRSWALLRLEDCEQGIAPTPPRVAAAMTDRGAAPVHRTRQLGVLMTESLAEPDADRSSAAWSMLGGPLQLFDDGSGAWRTIGIAVAPDLERAGHPASSAATAGLLIAGSDDGTTSFFQYEPQILPLSDIWGRIDAAIRRDLMTLDRRPRS
jgi:hypothetical protein